MSSIHKHVASRSTVATLLMGASLLVSGCDKSASSGTPTTGPSATGGQGSTGGTCVVDLDRVAQAAGWTAEIQRDFDMLKNESDMKVKSYFDTLNAQLEAKRRDLAAKAGLNPQQADDLKANRDLDKLPFNKEQREELYTAIGAYQQYAQVGQNVYNSTLNNRRATLVNISREALQPVVRRVAEANGFTIALTSRTDGSIFYMSPSVDVTNKVIDEVQKAPPARTIPPLPKLELPAEIRLSQLPAAASQPTTGPAGATTMPAMAPAATRPTAR